MENLQIASLKAGDCHKTALKLDSLFLVTLPPCPITDDLIKALTEWQFTELEESQEESGSTFTEEDVQEKPQAVKAAPHIELETSDITSDFIDEEENPALTAIKAKLAELTAKVDECKDDKIEAVRNVYNSYMTYIHWIFMHYASHKKLNIKEIMDTVSRFVKFVKENQQTMLRVSPSEESYVKNMIISHSIRSAVIATAISIRLNMPEEKLVELATATILHEIGQIRIPPQFYMKDHKLTASEKAQMNTHPIISYNILKEANFPLSIQLAALEHHERENGSGYPRHITGDKISLYSKIISVACSFEAITAPRTYKDERNTYAAMVELLKNDNNAYDPIVLKALLVTLSIFPIGSYVYLSNGKIAQVVDTNPTDPKNPVVQIAGDNSPEGKIQTSDNGIKIVRAMNKKETEDFLAAMKK
ncbi:HD-GYP domain-containing protein [Treponema sp.]|uniref:HD-GYP domain-containing protein n=1 Tax=Treponema sp. TaxID=166 RepID=UPI0025D65484|nr:HD-GYP domain-containing protein [Treponema sp.]MCR5218260.1 HD-GYP domain-containing protein [Treponema sp.]